MSDALELPTWIDEALVAVCAKCSHKAAGATSADGSGICPSCAGAGFIVLATRNGARATDHRATYDAVHREQPQTDVTYIEDDRAVEADDTLLAWQATEVPRPTRPDPGERSKKG